MSTYRWKPIEDLPEDWQDLVADELGSLAAIWIEQSARLRASEALKRFNDQLRRHWAIETGIIENLYSIDRGTTVLLIEKGIEASLIPHGATDKPADLVVSILKDQEEALEGLFDFVGGNRELSTSYIKQLHQVFTQHQDRVTAMNGLGRLTQVTLVRGEWKRLPNNPTRPDGEVHEYCPPEQVSAEMDRLIAMHAGHIAERVPPEIEAAWLHHRLTQIHPFQDGNGRIARALASLIFIRAQWFPLVIDRDARADYIAGLEKADDGDLRVLVELFVKIQKKAFLKALSISEDVLKYATVLGQVIDAAKDRLKARSQLLAEERRRVFDLSRALEDLAWKSYNDVAQMLRADLVNVSRKYSVTVDRSDSNSGYWFKIQIVETAKAFEYYADTRSYRAWVRLKIREERQAELIVAFHALGVEFLGIVAASAFLIYRDHNEDKEVTVDGPYPVCREIFQFSYNEDEKNVLSRFEKWLRDVILFGVDEWRRQL